MIGLNLVSAVSYYWRIDECNDANVWKGPTWNFIMSDYVTVEDFSYSTQNDMSAEWKTGLPQTCFDCGELDIPGGDAILISLRHFIRLRHFIASNSHVYGLDFSIAGL